MDVTPRELRDLEIREQFRGYNREDVDDLLERAAATIEKANERIRQLDARMQSGEGETGKSREMQETLQRTLILAQRTADQAIAEAQEQARATTEEAETRARTVLAEAETQAAQVAEGERRRLESEVLELGSRRDALVADVDALERFDTDYRSRLRSAIEADLDALSARAAVPSAPRPPIHDIAMPATADTIATPDPPAAIEVDADAAVAPKPVAREASSEPASSWVSPVGELSNGNNQSASTESSTSASGDEPDPFASDAPVESQVLDDEAFFATLREAVRDDAPLGPRDDDQVAAEGIYDRESEPGRFGGVFKRRR